MARKDDWRGKSLHARVTKEIVGYVMERRCRVDPSGYPLSGFPLHRRSSRGPNPLIGSECRTVIWVGDATPAGPPGYGNEPHIPS
ncbi:MAG: hypothetical protein QOE18_95 [Chloroflexota bacterium]|nr:hypothetical protein [Chloroflexota bacterium]